MKRLSLLVATVALLAVAAGPVVAAPSGNPLVNHWEVTCGDVTTVVVAKGVPGWGADLAKGDTPLLLHGGHVTIWEGGVVILDTELAPPPGLASVLVPCRIEGPVGVDPSVFHLVYDPAYMQFLH